MGGVGGLVGGSLARTQKGERAEPTVVGGIAELAVARVWTDGKHAGKHALSKSQVVARATPPPYPSLVFDDGVISLIE